MNCRRCTYSGAYVLLNCHTILFRNTKKNTLFVFFLDKNVVVSTHF